MLLPLCIKMHSDLTCETGLAEGCFGVGQDLFSCRSVIGKDANADRNFQVMRFPFDDNWASEDRIGAVTDAFGDESDIFDLSLFRHDDSKAFVIKSAKHVRVTDNLHQPLGDDWLHHGEIPSPDMTDAKKGDFSFVPGSLFDGEIEGDAQCGALHESFEHISWW